MADPNVLRTFALFEAECRCSEAVPFSRSRKCNVNSNVRENS
ncbi:hypothetical protein HMPREF0972_00178 [Actinomyces sp. oral taxon 848 str. F0332]|nr:hypothetical protein HMPREF0972_00178 [Actinomyces sp. oral taxon 848 str. F0332]